MTIKKRSISLMTFILFVLMGFIAEAYANQCIECHNSPRKLIQITREIAKTRPAMETKSKGLG
jgi:hypothetical protein